MNDPQDSSCDEDYKYLLGKQAKNDGTKPNAYHPPFLPCLLASPLLDAFHVYIMMHKTPVLLQQNSRLKL
jgi:hypothetical protein